MQKWLDLDIHGKVAMRVAADAPTAAQLEVMFAPFVSDSLERVDLLVTGDFEDMPDASHGEHEYDFTEDIVRVNAMDVQIHKVEGGFRANGRREMLTTVLPLVDRVAVTNGAGMIHAATVDYQGHGICMPAWGGVGKTSTIAKLLRIDGVQFMGDDWGLLSDDAQLLGYAKPMFIKPHHRPIYPHLFQDKKKPMVPSSVSRPIGQLTTLVHPFVTKYPKLSAVARKWSPEHMMVTPEQAFPNNTISTKAPLDLLVFVERHDGSSAVLTEQTEEWMVSRLVGNFHCEMALASREVVTAMAATNIVPLEVLFGEKADVLAKAVAGKPCHLLRVPAALPADKASDLIVEHVHKAMAEAGLS